jgi:hypothetical protein
MMFDTVYNVVGAAAGTVKGVAEVGKREAKNTTSSLSSHAFTTLSHLQAAVTARARNTTNRLYSLAGALSGVLDGVKYAGLSIWWWATDDEIKIKLLQGSPVKYKLKDLDTLLQNHHHSTNHNIPAPQHNNGGNGVSVKLGAPVNSSNDHLAVQNQQQHQQEQHKQERRRKSEDFGNSVDESVETRAASKSVSKSGAKTSSSSHNNTKKKALPSTPQQEEYSPRVLA